MFTNYQTDRLILYYSYKTRVNDLKVSNHVISRFTVYHDTLQNIIAFCVSFKVRLNKRSR